MDSVENVAAVRTALQAQVVDKKDKRNTFMTDVSGKTIDAHSWTSDACLRRYLRAQKGNVTKATEALIETFLWRESFGVNDVLIPKGPDHAMLMKESVTGKNYLSAYHALDGRPLICLHPAREDVKLRDHGNSMKLLVHTLESAAREMDAREAKKDPQEPISAYKRTEQWVILISFTNYSVMNAPPFATTKETLTILTKHYPERLGKAILVDFPFAFYAFWKLLTPLLDPVTKDKISLLRGSNDYIVTEFNKHIAPSQRNSNSFYGTGDYDQNVKKYHDAYWGETSLEVEPNALAAMVEAEGDDSDMD